VKRAYTCLVTTLFLALACAAAPLSQEQRAATVAFAAGLQNDDGGYRPTPATADSSLGATTSGLRTIKYFGGEARRKRRTTSFVMSCYHPTLGAFSDKPGGTPDVRTTAIGLMSLGELQGPIQEHAPAILRYFNENAKSLPDVYIAAAALDSAKVSNPNASTWIAMFAPALSTGDESTGKGAPELASAAITTLRLGGTLPNREHVARVLQAAQKPDGGFGAAETSDLSTTYRLMRAVYMVKAKPDLARLRAFIDRCRNPDAGYGPTPGQPATASATYNAGIVLHWIEELQK